MLNKISDKYNRIDVGFYRHDGLAVFKIISGPESERTKKNFQSLFKKHGLKIITECNKKVVRYFDITFNLKDRTYKPYHKPDNKITDVNVQLNHPPNIIKELSKSIEQRLSNNSSNETIFNEVAPLYEKVLFGAGYDVKLNYSPNKKTKQKNRKRNIIWFNPPCSKNVATKVGHYFLKLLDKHFPRQHKLQKIFNNNTVKGSYSCTKNIKSIIKSHNEKVLHQNQPCLNEQKCNCIKNELCPLLETVKLKMLYTKPASHAMNKPTTRTFI